MEKIICTHCKEENKPIVKYCFNCGYELPMHQIQQASTISQQVHKKEVGNNKTLLGTVVGIVVFGITYFLVQHFIFNPSTFDKVMMQAANELNETCPIMVDEFTRLDYAVALPENAFQYNYTLVDLIKAEVDLDAVKNYIQPSLITIVKTDPDLEVYRDNKTTMIYSYRDKNGAFVAKFSVTPELYE